MGQIRRHLSSLMNSTLFIIKELKKLDVCQIILILTTHDTSILLYAKNK
jgi:hypothetical protein